jgi:5'-deoxynucleotidase YfbR-like HD superfamily hydrolase
MDAGRESIQKFKDSLIIDDGLVQSEIEKILVYFNLKHTQRWNSERTGGSMVESVAEHVFGLHILAEYFLQLQEDHLDGEMVRKLITWHDMAEAVVGDMPTKHKTETHKEAELTAEKQLVENAQHISYDLNNVFNQYNNQNTRESQFVKALDKLEPVFHLVFLARKKNFVPFNICWHSPEEYLAHRKPYIEKFSILQRFDDIISRELDTLPYYKIPD